MFRFAATSVLFVGISRFLRGERWFNALESLRWQRIVVFQRLGGPLFFPFCLFSVLWKTFVCRNCLCSAFWGPRPAFRRSRRRPQAAGIHFRRKSQRASCKSRGRTACPGLMGGGGTRGRDVSARLPWPTDVPLRGNIGVVCRDFQIFTGRALV